MRIAVQGCCHGELSTIYNRIVELEERSFEKVDLLIICGDFQSVRHSNDLANLTCPTKYHMLKDFHEYYSGIKVAPVLTLFIGGNHEVPNVLCTLYYGGWVAPNIFYLGHSGVVNVGGMRIAGLSGIHKEYDYSRGYFESLPLDQDTRRSIYHLRKFEVHKLSALSQPIDILITHDWPRGIERHGDLTTLLRKKRHFQNEVHQSVFGNPRTAELLKILKPSYWFAAHLHVKYTATVHHPNANTTTHFMALDKVNTRNEYLQILEFMKNDSDDVPRFLHIPSKSSPLINFNIASVLDSNSNVNMEKNKSNSLSTNDNHCSHDDVDMMTRSGTGPEICFDMEWLAIVKQTHHRTPTLKYTQDNFEFKTPTFDDKIVIQNDLCQYFDPECIHKSTECTTATDNEFVWPHWNISPTFKDIIGQSKQMREMLKLPENDFSKRWESPIAFVPKNTLRIHSTHPALVQSVSTLPVRFLSDEELYGIIPPPPTTEMPEKMNCEIDKDMIRCNTGDCEASKDDAPVFDAIDVAKNNEATTLAPASEIDTINQNMENETEFGKINEEVDIDFSSF